MLTFSALDVETANSDSGSICQIGVAQVERGKIVESWGTLVNPELPFDRYNIRVHGITAKNVANSPTLPELRGELRDRLEGAFLVSHTAFDRGAIGRGMDRYGLPPLRATWLDSARIAKVAWPRLPSRSLPALAKKLRIEFRHHDAVEDARVAARVVIEASRLMGMSISDWVERGV